MQLRQSDTVCLLPTVQRTCLTRILFGKESPSFGNFSLVMAHRLMVSYPLVIVLSFPLCRVWALAIIFWWLLSGRWKERLKQFQTNPFLVLILLYLIFAAFGIVYTSATFYDAVREWHGRQTLLVVPEVYAPDYIDRLLDICRKHAVRAVIPLNDLDLPILACAKHRF